MEILNKRGRLTDDALTTTRSSRAAMPHDEAVAELRPVASWWRADVVAAFLATVGAVAQLA